MTDSIEESLIERVNLTEENGEIRLTFKNSDDWVNFLRKIAIHKHLREEDEANFLDDVMDCDSLFYAVSAANERLIQQKPSLKKSYTLPFEETGFLETGSFTYDIVLQKLKQKLERGPCFEERDTPEIRNYLAKQSQTDLEEFEEYASEFDGATDNRRLIKAYFAPFLISDKQADEISQILGMRTDGSYGRAR